MHRLKVLKTFLRAASPLTKLDTFRDLLEENAVQLTDRRHMSDLIPFLYSQERAGINLMLFVSFCTFFALHNIIGCPFIVVLF